MTRRFLIRFVQLGCVVLILSPAIAARRHVWAGRSLSDFEWAIHERLASLPMRGAFETIDFEADGNRVLLSGHVLNSGLKQTAEKAVRQVDGVTSVVDRIEVLPSTRGDDVLRLNVYRAVFKSDPPQRPDSDDAPRIHIIVKNGWVTLEGAVNSNAQRDMAHLAALKVTPHVSDYLRVVPADDPQRAGM